MKQQLKIACSKKNLGEIRKFISDSLEEVDLDSKTKSALILAIDEACANAIIHGNNNNEKNTLEVETVVKNRSVIISISDVGGTDFSRLKHIERHIEELVKSKSKGGMGLKLIHRIMDKVEYVDDGGVYKCRLHKYL